MGAFLKLGVPLQSFTQDPAALSLLSTQGRMRDSQKPEAFYARHSCTDTHAYAIPS